MKNKKIMIIVAASFIIFLTVGIISAVRQNTESAKSNAPKNSIAVQVETAKNDNIISQVYAKGKVTPSDTVKYYLDTPLKVEQVFVKIGDEVKKGDKLISYDYATKEELESQLSKAKINLEIQEKNLININPTAKDISQARSALNQAESSYKNSESTLKQLEVNIAQTNRNLMTAKEQLTNDNLLYEEGAISKSVLQTSEEKVTTLEEKLEIDNKQLESINSSLASASSQVDIAKNNLNNLLNPNKDSKLKNQIEIQQKQIELQKLQIKDIENKLDKVITETICTFNGTVLNMNAEEGSFASQSLPIIEIGNLSKLILTVDISEFDAPTLELFQKVIITGDGFPDEKYDGIITKIAPKAVEKRVNNSIENIVEIEVEVVSQDTKLKPGYTVEVEIITANHENVVVIPIMAILKDKDDHTFVYVVKDDNSLEKRIIKPIVYSDLYVEVAEVKEGEKVVTNPNPKTTEGTFVKPIEQKKSGDES